MFNIIEDKLTILKSLKTSNVDVGYKTGWLDAIKQVEYIIDEQKAIKFKDDVQAIIQSPVIFNNVNDYDEDEELLEYNGYEIEVKNSKVQMTYFKGTISISIGGKLKTMQSWKALKLLREHMSIHEDSVSSEIEESDFEGSLTSEEISESDIAKIYGIKK